MELTVMHQLERRSNVSWLTFCITTSRLHDIQQQCVYFNHIFIANIKSCRLRGFLHLFNILHRMKKKTK